jgi:signal transduction histidine kinase
MQMKKNANLQIYYDTFREISHFIHATDDMEEVLELVVWKASEAMQAKGAVLGILNLETQQLEMSAYHGLSDEFFAKRPVVSKPKIITDLYGKEHTVIINDIFNDPRVLFAEDLRREGVRLIMDLPLKFRSDLAGLLRLYFSSHREFSADDKDFAKSLAEQCACAIDKFRLFQEQKNKYDLLALQTEKLSALGRMAAGIAHEINNPLAGILLYSSNLHKKVKKEGPTRDGLEIIMRETQRCKIIIQELLEFARDNEPQKTMGDMNNIINKSINILENEFRLRHIKIEKTLAPDMKEALLDENQLQQVFVNLFLNAAQAIEDKGVITVRSQMDPAIHEFLVEVADNGCGIPEADIGRVFEPFFSTKKNGSGLGLAVSYGIISNHHGQLEVESTPGKGTIFTLRIPLLTQ